jgi:alpha-N-acetylglucosamine transferase
MYPQHWNLDSSSIERHWLRKAREEYGVKVILIQVQHFEGEHTWADSFAKLLALNQTQYERVISLDSDADVLEVRSEVQEDVLPLRLTPPSIWSSYFSDLVPLSLCPVHTGWKKVSHLRSQ